MELVLNRDYHDPTCTLGTIESFGRKLQTMERPWVPSPDTPAGAKGVSCIGAGRYRLEKHDSEMHKDVWALVNPALDVYHWDYEVPRGRELVARTVVLIHPANYASELKGCIAPGLSRDNPPIGSNGARVWMVQRSRDAINQLRNIIGGKIDVWLTIAEPEASS